MFIEGNRWPRLNDILKSSVLVQKEHCPYKEILEGLGEPLKEIISCEKKRKSEVSVWNREDMSYEVQLS